MSIKTRLLFRQLGAAGSCYIAVSELTNNGIAALAAALTMYFALGALTSELA